MNTSSLPQTRGFTLLEMTVVLLLMTLLASVAIRETNGLSFQVRYEQTRERLERIREAILGNPRQIINGQQAVSGFVADMGRLPNSLRELIEDYDCDGPSVDGNGDTNFNNDKCPWSPDSIYNSGLSSGWHGPYLNITGNPTDYDAFTDAWGNLSDDNNYGWNFVNAFPTLTLQSKGKNQTLGSTDTGYDEDFPKAQPSITREDWLVDISGGITINLLKPQLSDEPGYLPQNICMNLFYRADGALKYTSSYPLTIEENGSYQELRFSNFKDQSDTVIADIPIGKNAIGIYEYNGNCDPVNNPLYPADRQNPIQVDFHPRTGLPVINW
jgi:prepilin-type N-terminal cleavage/methylation domain-containing protein